MRGLQALPQLGDLKQAYQRLSEKPQVTESELALWSQWVRFDARLGEILVQYLVGHWRTIHSITLNQKIGLQPWPAALGVILDFVENGVSGDSVHSSISSSIIEQNLFRAWKATVLSGVKSISPQLFFLDTGRMGGVFQLQAARFPLQEYLNWGFLSREVLLGKPAEKNFRTHHYSQEVRHRVLSDLIQQSGRLTVSDYLSHLQNSISIRTAERDLKSHQKLKSMGKTSGRFYVKRIDKSFSK